MSLLFDVFKTLIITNTIILKHNYLPPFFNDFQFDANTLFYFNNAVFLIAENGDFNCAVFA